MQQHALEKLAARDSFKESGVASFKLRCAKGLECKVKKLDFELALLGSELQRQVAELVNTPAEQLKVIVGGQVVKGEVSLASQGMKNSSTLIGACPLPLTLRQVGASAAMEVVLNMHAKYCRQRAAGGEEKRLELGEDGMVLTLQREDLQSERFDGTMANGCGKGNKNWMMKSLCNPIDLSLSGGLLIHLVDELLSINRLPEYYVV